MSKLVEAMARAICLSRYENIYEDKELVKRRVDSLWREYVPDVLTFLRAMAEVGPSSGMVIRGAEKLGLPRWSIVDSEPWQPGACFRAMLTQAVAEAQESGPTT